ncbi:predicted protein [Nematostella vectensis]|uniref:EF-hand domain-containing protein n=1 Tax=Nematostella vectensis TaxID=45351 RepID=A7RKB5_NEMVE|nr:predicted protein [Nematostella vectensis]|eukprot:XP_001640282.1 predicted protein [Nematostella vectensis]
MQAGKTFFSTDVPSLVLRSLFNKYDVNGSGYLEEKEVRYLLQVDLGMNPDQTELYSLLLDEDGDNLISFEEFVKWLRSEEKFKNIDDSSRYAILCEAVGFFKRFDVSATNSLDRSEFKMMMDSMGHKHQDDIDRTFKLIDTHVNGRISFREFLQWLNWLPVM